MDPLRCQVKAAAVANLTDARYFAALGVDYLGFALEPAAPGAGPALGTAEVAAFAEWVAGPELVGEFGATPADAIGALAAGLGLHLVEVGPFADVRAVGLAAGLPLLQRLPLGTDLGPGELQAVLDRNAGEVRAFVLDASSAGLTWDALRAAPRWIDWLAAAAADYDVLVDVPAGPDQVGELLAVLGPLGLQVRGGDEEAVGVKSFDELDDYFDALRTEEA